MSCGIRNIDLLQAFPRGSLVEICGSPSTGRTTLLYGLLSRCIVGGEVAAVIDVTDAFDPVSATQAGVVLSELLWVRCGSPVRQGRSLTAVEQALGAADLLLQSGGFGVLALDFGNVSAREMQRIPLSAWFRFRRGVEGTQTLFVILVEEPQGGSSSASVLDLSQFDIDIERTGSPSKSHHIEGDCLIRTLHTRAEVTRGQLRKPVHSVRPVGEFVTNLQSYR